MARRRFLVGLVGAAVAASGYAGVVGTAVSPSPPDEQIVHVARNVSTLRETGPEELLLGLAEDSATREAEPTPGAGTGEELFLQQFDEFQERYGIDWLQWQELHRKDESSIGIPESAGEQEMLVLEYIRDIQKQRYNLLQWIIFPPVECFLPNYLAVPRTRSVGCPSGELEGGFVQWNPEGDVSVGASSEEEMQRNISEAVAALEEEAELKEDAVEVILEKQVKAVIEELTGESVSAQVELESEFYTLLVVYDSESDEIVRKMHYQGRLDDGARLELDALFAESDRYVYWEQPVAGIATDPVLIQAFADPRQNPFFLYEGDVVYTLAHEFIHHALFPYPVSTIPGEEGVIINETLAEIYGWTAAKVLFSAQYTGDCKRAEQCMQDRRSEMQLGRHIDDEGHVFLDETAVKYGSRAEEILLLRYGGTELSAKVVALYNRIGDPREAFDIFKQMKSADDVDELLAAYLLQEPGEEHQENEASSEEAIPLLQ